MKELIRICAKANKIDLLKDKTVNEKRVLLEKELKPFGVDCTCKCDLDFFNLQILSKGLKNKQAMEEAYEAISKEMIEIWNNLDYKKRNEFATANLAELKDSLLYFKWNDARIFIPFFDELMNTLYDKEPAVFELPQFFKLYKVFKERMIDPFMYGSLPYETGFVDIQFLGKQEKGFGFYCKINHSIYVIDQNKKVVVLPLSLSQRVDQLDPVRSQGWIDAVLCQDKRAMIQWCINCGQMEEDIKKRCIKYLAKCGE